MAYTSARFGIPPFALPPISHGLGRAAGKADPCGDVMLPLYQSAEPVLQIFLSLSNRHSRQACR